MSNEINNNSGDRAQAPNAYPVAPQNDNNGHVSQTDGLQNMPFPVVPVSSTYDTRPATASHAPNSYRWDFNEYGASQPVRSKQKKAGLIAPLLAMFLLICLIVVLVSYFSKNKLDTWLDDQKGEASSSSYTDSFGYAEESEALEEEAEAAGLPPDEAPSVSTLEDPAGSVPSVLKITKSVKDGSDALHARDIYKRLMPSVVSIQTYLSSNLNESQGAEGSGVIMSADGYIITNAHVVNGASVINVILSSGKSYEARLIGIDIQTDLAVIKIDVTGLTYAEFGDSEAVQIGDPVYAIGNPGGLEFASSMTSGMVSGINRNVTDSNGFSSCLMQTDAPINPGNSGGALVNEYGQVIGITSSKISAESFEGMGFAIPIHEAKPILDELISVGRVTGRPKIGFEGRMIDEITSRLYNIPTGILIESIENGSPLISAGIQVGDVIHSIEGVKILSASDLRLALANFSAGDSVNITVFRAGANDENIESEITIVLMEDI